MAATAAKENAIAGGLRAGDWVEVRSAKEILETLDDRAKTSADPAAGCRVRHPPPIN